MIPLTFNRAGTRWRDFWFSQVDASTLGVLRIAFAVVVTLWTLSLAPDLGAFFSQRGVGGDSAVARGWGEWTLLRVAGSDLVVGVVYLGLLAAAVALLVGWHSRISAAVIFVALVSLERANPFVFNSGDSLLRLLALYVMIAPTGAAFSLDRRRAVARGKVPVTTHAAWSLRLIQIQVTVMYLGAVFAKLQGPAWRDGTAASYAMRLPDLVRFPAPDVFERSTLAAHVATYGTIIVEGGLAVLLWHRRTRLPALVTGLLLHVSIDASIRVGFFTLAVFTAYLSFADPARVRAAAEAAGRAWNHSVADSRIRAIRHRPTSLPAVRWKPSTAATAGESARGTARRTRAGLRDGKPHEQNGQSAEPQGA